MTTSSDVFGDVEVKTKTKIDKPSMWKVILHNDNYTPMDFVVYVLYHIFAKKIEEANDLMMIIHNHGKGVAGIYSFEVAQQKALETVGLAKVNGHPLQATLEEDKE